MALTEQQRARRETNRRAAQQRRIKLGLGRGLALTTFDLTGRTPTFRLDALPAELSSIVLDCLPCEALARLALTNREWAAHVASMLAGWSPTTFNATQQRIAAATTFDELESLETMVRAHPRMRLKVPDWDRIYKNPTPYDDFGWPSESLKAYEFHVNEFRAPVGSLLLPDEEPVFKAVAQPGNGRHYAYKGHLHKYPANSRDERLSAARLHFRDLLEPWPMFSGTPRSHRGVPSLYERLCVAATVRLAPEQFVDLGAQILEEARASDDGNRPLPYLWQLPWQRAGASLLRRGEWTPELLCKLGHLTIHPSDPEYDDVCDTKGMASIYEEIISAEVMKEFMVQFRPPSEVDSQYFWFHLLSDSDCANECVPQFFPSETHPDGRGPGHTMEAHLQELVAHALPLGAAALTCLVKIAVAEVEDYYFWDDDDHSQYGRGYEDDDRHGYEVVGEFVDEWARQSGLLERDDLEEITEMLGSLPAWLKKLLAQKSLGWFEEIAKSGKADAARRLDVVIQICSALRREHVWAGWEERQQGEPIQ